MDYEFIVKTMNSYWVVEYPKTEVLAKQKVFCQNTSVLPKHFFVFWPYKFRIIFTHIVYIYKLHLVT